MKNLVRHSHKLNRRRFLQLTAMTTAGLAAGCASGGGTADTDTPAAEATPAQTQATPSTTSAGGYNEAPMLADLVASGSLPPVDERLPQDPLILESLEGIGQYGGTLRRGFRGVSDRWGPTKLVYHGLVWYDPDLNMKANIAESWEINEDASEWTFHLRQGMKWSDGQPLDASSVQWWYDNILLNETLTPSIPENWSTDRAVMELETPDPFTVVFRFAEPNPMFIYRVANITEELIVPGHYMAQYHADLTDDPEGLEAAVDESGLGTWDVFFEDRNWWYLNPDRPSFYAFIPKTPLSEELFEMERNPYFWAVDPDGNQLPYLDTINHRLFETPEVFNLRIINGEVDYQYRHVDAANFTLFKENEESGGYRVQLGAGDQHVVLTPNLTVQKPRLREFFQNRDVRIAMSLAVDRNTLNELAYNGLYTPRQYSPLEQSPQYYPEQANAYLDYDPERANQLLDEAGYAEKDADGFRVYPDGSGETISFVVEGTATIGSPDEDAVQIILDYLGEVGISATYRGIERSLYEEHWGANEIDAAFWGSGRSLVPIVDAAFFLGTGLDRPWAEAWGRWREDPSHPAAEEPPEGHWIWDIWDYWDQIQVEPDSDRQTELFYNILDIWAEELPQIGFLGQIPNPIIVKNGMRGLDPDYTYPLSNPTAHGGLIPVATYYWDDPETQG